MLMRLLSLHLIGTCADNIGHFHCGYHLFVGEFTDDLRCWFTALFVDQLVVVLQCHDALHLTPVQRFLVKLFAQLECDLR